MESVSGVVDQDVIEDNVVRVDYGQSPVKMSDVPPEIMGPCRYLPHLTSQEVYPLDNRVPQPIESESMWTTRVVGSVGLLSDPFIPVVAIAIESALPMAVETNIVAAEDEGSGLILISNIQRVGKPVRDVRAPLTAGSLTLADRHKTKVLVLFGLAHHSN